MDDFISLPTNPEEAFCEFVIAREKALSTSINNDRRIHEDHQGNYVGSFAPERNFVTSVLAFLDEYGIESTVEDISELNNREFEAEFGKFQSRVGYLTTRFQLRKGRIDTGAIGTLISISSSYKEQIGSLIQTIRKIVNQEIKYEPKRDKIFKKLAGLQSEVDRDRTTVDAVFSRLLDISDIAETSGEKIKPLVDQLERLKKLFWDGSKAIDRLPKPDRPKQISKEPDQQDPSSDMDDEIPF